MENLKEIKKLTENITKLNSNFKIDSFFKEKCGKNKINDEEKLNDLKKEYERLLLENKDIFYQKKLSGFTESKNLSDSLF